MTTSLFLDVMLVASNGSERSKESKVEEDLIFKDRNKLETDDVI